MYRIAFDIGGTFTDFTLQDLSTGRLSFWKTLSSPSDPARAVLKGLGELMEQFGIAFSQVSDIIHATTIAANAIIERKGSPTGLIASRGFRDVAIIGREKRYETYNLFLDKPQPLVRRRVIQEVDERVLYDGSVLVPLDLQSVDRALDALGAEGVSSIAVCLMHSYANPEHERQVRERILSRSPEVSVSISSEISPKYREYERTSTTVANAFVKPIVRRYLTDLLKALASKGFHGNFFIMRSNGGLATPELVTEFPIWIVESGPAAGVLMCNSVAQRLGYSDILTFDMGGTTAKVGAVDGGEPATTPTFEVDAVSYKKGSGLPLNISAIELLEIGAGGGSLATIKMGLIQVGPESAGADPGPVCYGLGGSLPAVTDANLVLGYLNPEYFLGGAMKLDAAGAAEAIRKHIAEPLGLSVGEAAWGIHTVANANMERAMRIMSIERGRDPRRYAMVAFGGAGPVHAARLARAMGVPALIVPAGAGVGSAVGLLAADVKVDVSQTRVLRLASDATAEIQSVYSQLGEQAQAILQRMELTAPVRWSRYAYMRYEGQGYEMKVDLPDGPIDGNYAARCLDAFHVAYRGMYGYDQRQNPVQVVDWYLVGTSATNTNVEGARSDRPEAMGGDYGGAVRGSRPVYFPEAGGYVDCKVIDRYAMQQGVTIPGPAVVEERESTTVVLPADQVTITAEGHLLVHIGAAAQGDVTEVNGLAGATTND